MDLHPATPEFPSSTPSASAQEDMSKKVRKPYTITKSRESWTEQEHDKFLEALQLFDRDWKKIEAFIGSKSVIQIRSHAQKYFLKVQKNGTGEHVPPPRPKRKSSQPYPQKAVKTVLAAHQMPISVSETEPAYTVVLQSNAAIPVSSASLIPTWAHHMGAHESVCPMIKALPDFTEIYRFLGSVFDPTTNDHLDRMQEMAPINRETVLLLMSNLSINLSSADFEEHNISPSVYDAAAENIWPGSGNNKKRLPDAAVVGCSPILAAI